MTGSQGEILELTVIGCSRLKDTEWITKQDPYVVLEYASNRYRTRTDTDGGRNPKFDEKYMFALIEGLPEINVSVWNSNTLSNDDFIGSGKVLLKRVLSEGYHDDSWPIKSWSGKFAGEVRIVMHYKKGAKVNNQKATSSTSHDTNCYPPAPPSFYPPYTTPPYPPPPSIYYQPPYPTYPPPTTPSYAPSAPPIPPPTSYYPPPSGYPTYDWWRRY